MIEAMLMNKPIAVGPSIYNFKHIVEMSQSRDLIFRFDKVDELENTINKLMHKGSLQKIIAEKTSTFIKENSGASKKILKLINQYF